MTVASAFCFGYVKELDIPLVIESQPQVISAYGFALVTVIDSHHDVAELTSVERLLSEQRVGVSTLDRHLVVPRDLLLELVDPDEWNLFNGFDEVWFFPRPPLIPLPADIVITSEAALDRERAGRVAEWMQASGAGLALGDGYGLNYATFDPAIADILESRTAR